MNDKTQEKQRLLIVDDSKVIRVTARKILRDHFETIEAVDGEDAWQILTGEESFSLVVSDLNMPNLDGFGLLERIRNSHLPHVHELPVIIITGANDTESTMKQARQAGATDFIGKPFDAVHLLARTQAHANSHAATNTLMVEKTRLEDSLTIDGLTGLSNEVSFMERGYQQLAFAIRHNSSLAVFRIEIDDFGDLFQQHGDEFVEAVIHSMGKTLSGAIRQEDTAARIGTARFALLLPGMNTAGIRSLAERISRESSEHTHNSGDSQVRVTASIGVGAPDIRRDTRLDELLSLADQRLVQAIAQGGNRIVYEIADKPPAMDEHSAEDSAIEDSASNELPTNVAIMNPFQDESAEVEEIEIFSPDLPLDLFVNRNNKPAKIECLSAGSSEPSSNTFAGPVPDNIVDLPAPETSGKEAVTAPGSPEGVMVTYPASPANDTDEAQAEASTPETGEDSITISAPITGQSQPAPDIKAANDTQAITDTTLDVSAQGVTGQIMSHDTADADEPEIPPQRKGFLRRMLALFGRSRSRK